MKLPFLNCKGSMCDPEIQSEVFEMMLSVDPDQRTDYWCGIGTADGAYDCNIYGAEFGADDGYLNIVLNPVYEIDGDARTEYENVVGRATIKESDVNLFWVGGVRPLPKQYNVFDGDNQVNSEPLTWREALLLHLMFERKGQIVDIKEA